jgi:hypothetical protein
VASARTDSDERHAAHAYFIADPAVLERGTPIEPDTQDWARWNRRS